MLVKYKTLEKLDIKLVEEKTRNYGLEMIETTSMPISDDNGDYLRHLEYILIECIPCCSDMDFFKDSLILTKINGFPKISAECGYYDNEDDYINHNIEVKMCPFCGEEITYKEVGREKEFPMFITKIIEENIQVTPPKYEKRTRELNKFNAIRTERVV